MGIAAIQVPNSPPPLLADAEARAQAVYKGLSVEDVLGRTAVQAGYRQGSTEYEAIRSAKGGLPRGCGNRLAAAVTLH